MRKNIVFVLVILIFTSLQVFALDTQNEEINNIRDAYYEASNGRESVFEFDFDEALDGIISGENILNPQNIISKIVKIFANEVYVNIHIALSLIVIAIISSIISNLQSSFETKSVTEIAFLTCYIMFAGILIKGFYECFTMATDVIGDQIIFLKACVPTYISLMIASGSITTAATFEPLFLYFVQFIGSMMQKFIMPFVFWISIITMVNSISDKFHITKLIQFSKQAINWIVGGLLSIFIGLLSLSGISTSVIDGVGLKTVKYAVGNFVPLVGNILSQTVDTVLASTLVIKNSLGVVGIIVMIAICITPILKMLVLICIYKLTASIIEPISDKRIVDVVSNTASSLTLVFITVISTAIMFILSITVILKAGNISSYIR